MVQVFQESNGTTERLNTPLMIGNTAETVLDTGFACGGHGFEYFILNESIATQNVVSFYQSCWLKKLVSHNYRLSETSRLRS